MQQQKLFAEPLEGVNSYRAIPRNCCFDGKRSSFCGINFFCRYLPEKKILSSEVKPIFTADIKFPIYSQPKF